MTDRNRDDDNRWGSGNDSRGEYSDRDRNRSGQYRGERQSWQQDYSGEFDRSQGDDSRSQERIRAQSAGRQGANRYDEGSEFQTTRQRYQGTGAAGYGSSSYGGSNYGAGSSGDYFGPGDFGSGASAWDRGSSQSYAGSPRYGSGNRSGNELGSMSSYAPGSYDRSGNSQSYQRDHSSGQDRGFLERAGDEVMSWFGDEDAARRREEDHRGRGPADYTRSDERIREDANDRLTEDSRVDARNITVAVEGGEVTLSGTVANRDAKRRAEDCVEAVSGVKHVQNNLRVDVNAGGSAGGNTASWNKASSGGASSSEATNPGLTTGSSTSPGTTGAAARSSSTTGSTSA